MKLAFIFTALAATTVVACASPTTNEEPATDSTITTTQQALGKDGNPTPDERAACRRNCLDQMVWFANQCLSGPGASACIRDAVDQADACIDHCNAPRPNLPDPGLPGGDPPLVMK